MQDELSAGVAIRKARQRERMTQAELADLLGVHVVSIRNWERGRHYPQRYAGAVEAALGIILPEPDRAAS